MGRLRVIVEQLLGRGAAVMLRTPEEDEAREAAIQQRERIAIKLAARHGTSEPDELLHNYRKMNGLLADPPHRADGTPR